MPLSSAIPRTKRALVDALNARPALAGKVTYGTPRETPRDEWIHVGRVECEERPVHLGRSAIGKREENFRISVVISVVRSWLELPETVAERAFDLAAELEDELRQNPTLGLDPGTDGLYWAGVVRKDVDEEGDGSQRQAVLTVRVACMARI